MTILLFVNISMTAVKESLNESFYDGDYESSIRHYFKQYVDVWNKLRHDL